MIKELINFEVEAAVADMAKDGEVPADLKEDIRSLIAGKFKDAVGKKIKIVSVKGTQTKFGLRQEVVAIDIVEGKDPIAYEFFVFGEGFVFILGETGYLAIKNKKVLTYRPSVDRSDVGLVKTDLDTAFSQYASYDVNTVADHVVGKGMVTISTDGSATLLHRSANGKSQIPFRVYANTPIYPTNLSYQDVVNTPVITDAIALFRTYRYKGEIRTTVATLYVFSTIKKAKSEESKSEVNADVDSILGEGTPVTHPPEEEEDDGDINMPSIDV